ncbi:MAG TPA: HlyD family secretion protein [Candidatus Methanoperedens sp.]|nr:HlyD family secretion protein [Candidatus Methanoperedens sp.]
MSEAPQPARRRFIGFVVIAVIGVAVIAARGVYQRYTHTHIRTDDAYVEGTIYTVAARIAGTVAKVNAASNQRVRAGEVLVEIDPDVARTKVKEAESALQAETARGGELETQVASATKRIAAAEAGLARVLAQREELASGVAAREADARAKQALLDQARIDLQRTESLVAKKVSPRDRLEKAKTAFESAKAGLEAAQELVRQAQLTLANHATAIAQARAAVEVERAARAQVEAARRTNAEQVRGRGTQVELAQLTLGYMKIVSPADGFVTKKAVQVGNQVQAGQPLLAVVSLADPAVIANYKETQLHSIRPGQRARLSVDALPGREFTGRVESIMAGTGAAFSLFPPENASGNYVKVVQRIPVKIVLDPQQPGLDLLRVGMSVVPTILAAD